MKKVIFVLVFLLIAFNVLADDEMAIMLPGYVWKEMPMAVKITYFAGLVAGIGFGTGYLYGIGISDTSGDEALLLIFEDCWNWDFNKWIHKIDTFYLEEGDYNKTVVEVFGIILIEEKAKQMASLK